jgi:hypothetical protein
VTAQGRPRGSPVNPVEQSVGALVEVGNRLGPGEVLWISPLDLVALVTGVGRPRCATMRAADLAGPLWSESMSGRPVVVRWPVGPEAAQCPRWSTCASQIGV